VTRRLVVVGGGIAGLSAAYRAHELFAEHDEAREVLLLESESEVGGKVRTSASGGHLYEHGPNAFIDPGSELAHLVEVSGVEVLQADPDSKRRFLCKAGALHELSSNPIALLKSGLLPVTAKIRALAEPTIGARRSDHGNTASEGWGDESVEAFLARRFGSKMAELFAGPLVSGIFAGDPRRLSLPSCFPRIAAMERENGSILRGMSALRREGVKVPTLQTPAEGMQSLPRSLGERAPFSIRTGVSVNSITSDDDAWDLALSDGEHLSADALAIATSVAVASRLLEPVNPSAAVTLSKISSPHLAVVSLIYSEEQAAHAPRGFGALHAHDGHSNLLGVLHESHIFPTRTPDGALNLRVMMGGSTRPDLADSSDQELLDVAIEELATLHGFTSPPTQTNVTRWTESIPQYHLGHARLMADLDSALSAATTPPLALAGNFLTGVSLSDTAASGVRCAEALRPSIAN